MTEQGSTQAPTVALPKRLPLVIEPANRDESADKDAKIVNAYVEYNKKTDEYWVFKRPGLLQSGATKVGNGYGVYNWNGDIYSIFGATLYKNLSSIGTVDATGGVYQFSTSLGSTPRLQLGNAVKAYNWDDSTLVQMSGGNFPGNTYADAAVKGWAYLDGSTYIFDVASFIHGSDVVSGLNRPDLWTELTNLLGAQIEPDKGICLAKQLVYVIAMKEWSTEVFYDAQNTTDSPLGPVQGAKINYGCISADSVQDIDGVLFWLSTTRASSVEVVMVAQLKATIISTAAVERSLSAGTFSTIASFGFKYAGHSFYGFTLKTENITWVYDVEEELWNQWTDSAGDYFKVVSSTYLAGTGRILQHETNGKLYLLDNAYTNDDGSVITVDLYTPNWDGGTRRSKQMNMLEFVGDQTVGSELQVRTNDFDYDATKWTQYRKVDMGVRRPTLTNCGSFTRRATHIRHQSDTRMRLQAVEYQIDLGVL